MAMAKVMSAMRGVGNAWRKDGPSFLVIRCDGEGLVAGCAGWRLGLPDRYAPPRQKVCKVLEGCGLGLDFWTSGRNQALAGTWLEDKWSISRGRSVNS